MNRDALELLRRRGKFHASDPMKRTNIDAVLEGRIKPLANAEDNKFVIQAFRKLVDAPESESDAYITSLLRKNLNSIEGAQFIQVKESLEAMRRDKFDWSDYRKFGDFVRQLRDKKPDLWTRFVGQLPSDLRQAAKLALDLPTNEREFREDGWHLRMQSAFNSSSGPVRNLAADFEDMMPGPSGSPTMADVLYDPSSPGPSPPRPSPQRSSPPAATPRVLPPTMAATPAPSAASPTSNPRVLEGAYGPLRRDWNSVKIPGKKRFYSFEPGRSGYNKLPRERSAEEHSRKRKCPVVEYVPAHYRCAAPRKLAGKLEEPVMKKARTEGSADAWQEFFNDIKTV